MGLIDRISNIKGHNVLKNNNIVDNGQESNKAGLENLIDRIDKNYRSR